MKKPTIEMLSQSAARKLEAKILQLSRDGHMKQALACCRQLNEGRPGFTSGWYTTSQLLAKVGNAGMALRAIDEAIIQQPGESRWQLQKAFCLMQLGRTEEARAIAIALDAQELTTAYQCGSLGLLLSRLSEQERALGQYQRAVLLEPDLGEHYYNLATVQRFLGHFEAAETTLALALAKNPEDFEAYKLRSDLRTQTPDNNHVESLQQSLERYAENPRACVQLHYSMAKELEDLGQWQKSFDHLRQGAHQRRKLMRYEVRGDLDTMEKIAEVYSRSMFDQPRGGADNNEAIFIIGMPRTGTTLVERVVGSHSEVYAAGELNNFAIEMMKEARRSQMTAATAQARNKIDLVRQSADIDFGRLGASYIQSTRPGTGRVSRFTDKMPVNFLYAGLIHLALPGAKIVHLKRHPLDTCYAIYKNLFADAYPFSYELQELARYYAGYERLMAHWRQMMPGVIYDIHYEDVVADLEGQSRKLLQYCGLQWQQQCLSFHQNESASTTASATQVRQAVYNSSVGKWRHFANELEPLVAELEAQGVELPPA